MSVDRTKEGVGLGSAAAVGARAWRLLEVDRRSADRSARRPMRRRTPRSPIAYLPVHDLPPDREEAVIAPAERAKIEKELIDARDRQASAAAGQDRPPAPEPGRKVSRQPAILLARPGVRAKRTPIQPQIRAKTSSLAPEFALNP